MKFRDSSVSGSIPIAGGGCANGLQLWQECENIHFTLFLARAGGKPALSVLLLPALLLSTPMKLAFRLWDCEGGTLKANTLKVVTQHVTVLQAITLHATTLQGGTRYFEYKRHMLRAFLRFLEIATNETRFARQGNIEHVPPAG